MRFVTKMLAASALLLGLAASAHADEMQWDLKNRSGMRCELRAGMTLKRGLDFVETKKLVCYEPGAVLPTVTSMVSCGPEGSVTRFGRKVRVSCKQRAEHDANTQWVARR